jgi:hypothetical protein
MKRVGGRAEDQKRRATCSNMAFWRLCGSAQSQQFAVTHGAARLGNGKPRSPSFTRIHTYRANRHSTHWLVMASPFFRTIGRTAASRAGLAPRFRTAMTSSARMIPTMALRPVVCSSSSFFQTSASKYSGTCPLIRNHTMTVTSDVRKAIGASSLLSLV